MSRKKSLLKPVAKVVDGIFANPSLRRKSTKLARLFIDRYTHHGTETVTSSSRFFDGPWSFMLDTPKLEKTGDKKVYVSGWFVPDVDKKVQMRIKYPSGKSIAIKSDIKRFDVAEVLSKRLGREVSNTCGFGKTIPVDEDGEYFVQAKIANTWKNLSRFNLRFDPDFIVSDIFNGNMAYNYASHVNLINNKRQYFFEKEAEFSFERSESDAKLVAFYLPQFHPFKENNEWWGKGFTEWSNVSTAVPRYVGHEQPKIPTDLGFYDLRVEDNLKSQVDMAKKYGVAAFAFYYYWFSGKRLMETPLDIFMKHKEWDFNFMICWANENWTRRWDGRNQDILIAQEHNSDDPLKFIKDVEPILLDPRYLRVDNKPVLSVYRADELDDTARYVAVWREYFMKKHGLELHLVAVQSFSSEDPKTFGFDKGIEFAPLTISARLKKDIPRYNIVDKILDVEFTGAMYDYRPIALEYYKKLPKFSAYRSVMPRWDNDARRKGSGGVFANANPDLYGEWLSKIVEQANTSAENNSQNLVFINAWNEWAEGAYLEPDTMYGHAYLRRTAEVLALHSENQANKENFPIYGIRRSEGIDTAIVIHLYYADMWKDFEKHLKYINNDTYDLYVTIPAKNEYIREKILQFSKNAQVIIVPNRGRDVLPFVHLARRLQQIGYKKFLKLHSKKSTHRQDGNAWVNDMLRKLLPANEKGLHQIMLALDREDTGIVGPYGHYISLSSFFGSNHEKTHAILESCLGTAKATKIVDNLEGSGFFAGTMFWGRFDAIDPILNKYYQASDFEPEAAQIDGTFAHAVERSLTVIPRAMNKKIYTTHNGDVMTISVHEALKEYDYAKNA